MAEIYSTDRFAVLHQLASHPSMSSLATAARFLQAVFARNNIEAALFGGYAVYLRGGPRSTVDVDMTVNGDMESVLRILRDQTRLAIPMTHGTTALTVFVFSGGSWESSNLPVKVVSVDIVISGNLGTPRNLRAGAESMVPTRPEVGGNEMRVITIRYQVGSKLTAFFDRQADKDYLDITHLIKQYPTAVWQCYDKFEEDECEFYAREFAERNPGQTTLIHFVRRTLGLEL